MEAETLSWDDPWLLSLDLEYHNIDPARGLFFQVQAGKRIGEWNQSVRIKKRATTTGQYARVRSFAAVASFRSGTLRHQLGFDRLGTSGLFVMGDPFSTYTTRSVLFCDDKTRAT